VNGTFNWQKKDSGMSPQIHAAAARLRFFGFGSFCAEFAVRSLTA